MIQLSVALDPAMHHRLARIAVAERATMNQLIREALTLWFKTRPKPTPPHPVRRAAAQAT